MSKKNQNFTASYEDYGLFIDTYSPGDGITRYRFFTEPKDYFSDNGLFTALGRKEALAFARGFCAGKLAKSESDIQCLTGKHSAYV